MRRRRGCNRRSTRGSSSARGRRRSRCRRSPTAAGGGGGGGAREAYGAARGGRRRGRASGGGGGCWPTEPAKFPADSLRVGAAVEVRRRASSGADSGAAGGWRPGTVQSLVSAFNFRVRVCFDEPVRGAPRCVWLVCENDGEFPALRLDGEGASAAGCHEFPSQSLGFEGASGVFELRPAQRGSKDGVVGEAEVAMTRRGGWVPAIVEEGGTRSGLGCEGRASARTCPRARSGRGRGWRGSARGARTARGEKPPTRTTPGTSCRTLRSPRMKRTMKRMRMRRGRRIRRGRRTPWPQSPNRRSPR